MRQLLVAHLRAGSHCLTASAPPQDRADLLETNQTNTMKELNAGEDASPTTNKDALNGPPVCIAMTTHPRSDPEALVLEWILFEGRGRRARKTARRARPKSFTS